MRKIVSKTSRKISNGHVPKKIMPREMEAMWTAIQKKEKELKRSPQTKKQGENITDFLRNHQINPQTGYIESKWKEKTHYVSCDSKVIK